MSSYCEWHHACIILFGELRELEALSKYANMHRLCLETPDIGKWADCQCILPISLVERNLTCDREAGERSVEILSDMHQIQARVGRMV